MFTQKRRTTYEVIKHGVFFSSSLLFNTAASRQTAKTVNVLKGGVQYAFNLKTVQLSQSTKLRPFTEDLISVKSVLLLFWNVTPVWKKEKGGTNPDSFSGLFFPDCGWVAVDDQFSNYPKKRAFSGMHLKRARSRNSTGNQPFVTSPRADFRYCAHEHTNSWKKEGAKRQTSLQTKSFLCLKLCYSKRKNVIWEKIMNEKGQNSERKENQNHKKKKKKKRVMIAK